MFWLAARAKKGEHKVYSVRVGAEGARRQKRRPPYVCGVKICMCLCCLQEVPTVCVYVVFLEERERDNGGTHVLTLLGLQSRFKDKLLKIRVVCPQSRTAVLKGLQIIRGVQ